MANILIPSLPIAESGPPMPQCDEDRLEMQAGSLLGSGEDPSEGNFTVLVALYEILLMVIASNRSDHQYVGTEVCNGVTLV